ncbi:COG1361 S-layer family protein [Methanoplanus endosymbiosus]|uniref:S-layer protein n=1 Tax=Methanoplanus endosymbiosus TaxID=33865 RepID=A0A9E7TIZ5_9EURY|nr:S-layer protein [Methanoplanus endosymbiosus]UUX93088.1 S-layer protein [Methanoplanus endosymbiosus]
MIIFDIINLSFRKRKENVTPILPHTRFSGNLRPSLTGCLIAAILVICMLAMPVSGAGEKFIWSEPQLTATIEGSYEFFPGNTYSVTVLIENMAVDTEELLALDYPMMEIDPADALGTDAALTSGDAPVIVKSDSYMVGNIGQGESLTVTYSIYVNDGAEAGSYNLVLMTESRYVFSSYFDESGELRYDFRNSIQETEIPVKIKGKFIPEELNVTTENLNSGKEGYINVGFINSGYAFGKDAEAEIILSPYAPVTVEEGSVYLGDIASGDAGSARFKAIVSGDVESGIYPAEFIVIYTDEFGNSAQSEVAVIGIPVGKGPKFEVLSEEITFSPGDTGSVCVEYRNTGDATAYGANSRITAKSPFTAVTDSVILGDISPGETVTAEYKLSLDGKAILKPYALNSEIKYRDEYDNLCLSDELKVELIAVQKSGIGELITNPVVDALILAVILFGIYFVLRKKNQK